MNNEQRYGLLTAMTMNPIEEICPRHEAHRFLDVSKNDDYIMQVANGYIQILISQYKAIEQTIKKEEKND